MGDSSTDLTTASQAFSCRSNLRDLTLKSQALEHDFYAGLASAVEKASRDLVDRFSKLMQDSMPGWSNQAVIDFCRETGVKSEWAFNWKADFVLYRTRETEAAEAANRRSMAEKNRSKFAGWFGAKTGMERNYTTANTDYKLALAEENRLAALAKDALAKSELSGKALIEELMCNTAGIADTRHCLGLREELRGVAEGAERSLANFREQQLAVARDMNGQVAKLLRIYGG